VNPCALASSKFDIRRSMLNVQLRYFPDRNTLGFSPMPNTLCSGKWLSNPNRQRVLTRLCRENAAIAPPEILRSTQKLLDRVLFCAFCEDRGLLPAESLTPNVTSARAPAGNRQVLQQSSPIDTLLRA
jgi:hypothetical protein